MVQLVLYLIIFLSIQNAANQLILLKNNFRKKRKIVHLARVIEVFIGDSDQVNEIKNRRDKILVEFFLIGIWAHREKTKE